MLWAASVEAAIRENRHPPHRAGGKKIFAELVAKYTHTLIAHCKDGPARQMHLDWFKEYFVGLKPAEITPYRGAAARDALAAEKFKRNEKLNEDGTVQANAREFTRSGATVDRYLATLSHMLNMAK